ncbi:MAG: molybdate ABC transporter substrate-binding protein [Xanthobacteraceae bacterium]|nr:molybdate ABC transporter substrate-binding protein [Xanthobacteraceae bacterium]MCW5676794.1 molybdate ABC transporter substrate-binding protein [Xanthobacteraceae bacterium]
MKRRLLIGAALSAFALTFTFPVTAPAQTQNNTPIVVFAAASMKNALDEVAGEWSKANKTEVKISYAASSALAKQIENAAPADVFVSADLKWMDYLEQKNLVRKGTRRSLLGNTLVLIARKDGKFKDIKIGPNFDLAKLLGNDRLAVGAVDAVPAGRYAKAALEKLGIWKSVEGKLAQAENVRVALAYVARGETPLGIVYGTDAASEANVIVAGTFPDGSYPPIVYPVAQLESSKNPKVADFLKSLSSPSAQAIFKKHGFSVLAAAKTN